MKSLQPLKSLTRFVTTHFIADDCLSRASALTFTTLLAIVPLMYVSLSILSWFPFAKTFGMLIQNFIFKNFVPSTGKILQIQLASFAEQATTLPTWDILFLGGTALMLLLTIEQALNVIWRAPKARHNLHALVLYCSILCIAPLLIGMSLALSSYLFSLPLLNASITPWFVTKMIPFLFSFLSFTFLYAVLPNCPVSIWDASIGGVFVAIVFELAKYIFALYLFYFQSYDRLYGAFAVIPMFFIWLYLVWVLTLLGAEISYAMGQKAYQFTDSPQVI